MTAKNLTLDDLTAAVDREPTPKEEAVDIANAELGNVGLPTYSDLVEALRSAIKQTPRRYTDKMNGRGDRIAEHPAWVGEASALLARIPS